MEAVAAASARRAPKGLPTYEKELVMGTTAIEWTNETWNPTVGCSKVSAGCRDCYAETLHRTRLDDRGVYPPFKPWTKLNAEHNVTLAPGRLDQPLRWRKPRMVFVNSMSDLFHELVPDGYIARVFAVMAAAERHTFQVLTKRPERMRELLLSPAFRDRVDDEFGHVLLSESVPLPWPVPNVWLGTSIESRKWVARADDLRATPAAVRFISAEPLLGPLLRSIGRCPKIRMGDGQQCIRPVDHPGTCTTRWGSRAYDPGEWPTDLDLTGIDWLIVGGESGATHRELDPQWMRDLRDACLRQCPDCAALGEYVPETWRPDFEDGRTHWASCTRHTAFFVKQMGGVRLGTKLEDLPEDLRIREFPR